MKWLKDPKTGGKRDGAGRPPSTNPANKMISVKLTQDQYQKWVEIGASRWLKRMLNESLVDKESPLIHSKQV